LETAYRAISSIGRAVDS